MKGVILKAKLINDFIGVGLGLTAVDKNDIELLHDASVVARAPIACVGAGTGLGEV
jgi:glucokinase